MFKKISAVGVSCVTALVLMLSALASPASVSAVTLAQMANTAIDCIISHEGSYGSVNANDCGAVSVGKLQWHADRALSLMRETCELCPSFAEEVLGTDFYNEIMSATSWSNRTFNSTEKAAASTLLASEYGVQAQDETAFNDVQGYIITGQNKGITDPGALVLYADIYNFGCGIASRIAKRAASYAGTYADVTLDDMYTAAMNDAYGSNSAFVSRTNNVYEHLLGMNWGEASDAVITTPAVTTTTTAATTTTTVTVEFTEDGAGTYTVKASSLNMRSGPGTGYSVITLIPNSATVTVTAVSSNNWAAVEYNSYSGYCSMDYLVPAAETTTAPAETTTAAPETTTSVSQETTASSAEVTTTAETTTTTEETSTTTTTTTTTTEVTTTAETTAETATTTKAAEAAPGRTDVIVNSSYASVYGDVNCDGAVTVADAVLLHKYLAGVVYLNVEQLANSDCSYDTKLSEVDVNVIMQHLTGHYTALPII